LTAHIFSFFLVTLHLNLVFVVLFLLACTKQDAHIAFAIFITDFPTPAISPIVGHFQCRGRTLLLHEAGKQGFAVAAR
jgi:hypothetical protein